MSQDTIALQTAADEIEAILGPDQGAAALAFNPADLCAKYKKLKPALETALSFIEKLPFPPVKTVVKAVKLLMVIADGLCP